MQVEQYLAKLNLFINIQIKAYVAIENLKNKLNSGYNISLILQNS